jgi:hypothetical protein
LKFFAGPKVKDFKDFLDSDAETIKKMEALKTDVNLFATKFPMPGFEDH